MKRGNKKTYRILLAAVAVVLGLSAGMLAAAEEISAETGHRCPGGQLGAMQAITGSGDVLDSDDSATNMGPTHAAHTWYLNKDVTGGDVKFNGDCTSCVAGHSTVNICLNGHIWDLGDDTIDLGDNVQLTISDCTGKGVIKANDDIFEVGSDSSIWVTKTKLTSSGGHGIVLSGGSAQVTLRNNTVLTTAKSAIENTTNVGATKSTAIDIQDSTLKAGAGYAAINVGSKRINDTMQLSGKVRLDGGDGAADVNLMNNHPIILGGTIADIGEDWYAPNPDFKFLPLSGDSRYMIKTSNVPTDEKVVLVAEPYTGNASDKNLEGKTIPLTEDLVGTYDYYTDDSNIHVYLKDNKIYAAYKSVIEQLADIDEYLPIDEDGDTNIDYFIPENLFPEDEYYPVDKDNDGEIDHYLPVEALNDEDGDGVYTPEDKDKPEYILVDEDGDGDIDKAIIKDEVDLDDYVPIDKDGDNNVDNHVPEDVFDKNDYIPVDKDNDGKIDHYVPEGVLQDEDGDGIYTPENMDEPEYILVDEDGDGDIDKAVTKDEVDLDDYVPIDKDGDGDVDNYMPEDIFDKNDYIPVDKDNDGKNDHYVPDGVLQDKDGDGTYIPKNLTEPEYIMVDGDGDGDIDKAIIKEGVDLEDYIPVDMNEDGKPEHHVPVGVLTDEDGDGVYTPVGKDSPKYIAIDNNNDGRPEMFVKGDKAPVTDENDKNDETTATGDDMNVKGLIGLMALMTAAATIGIGAVTVRRRTS